MNLSQVEYAPHHDASNILSLCMGKNTPERKDYIMENLVVTVEEGNESFNMLSFSMLQNAMGIQATHAQPECAHPPSWTQLLYYEPFVLVDLKCHPI